MIRHDPTLETLFSKGTPMDTRAILQPLFVMALLNVVMLVWMMVTRIPAMSKAGIDTENATKEAMQGLPPGVTQVADNYNHLFEQPTLFYAVVLAIAVLGQVDSLHVQCAWAFAGLRVVHSLVQATVNIISIRFTFFILSWIALAVMIVRGSLQIFS
jgi:hypothetical protein